jgi:hypothetical protein
MAALNDDVTLHAGGVGQAIHLARIEPGHAGGHRHGEGGRRAGNH